MQVGEEVGGMYEAPVVGAGTGQQVVGRDMPVGAGTPATSPHEAP